MSALELVIGLVVLGVIGGGVLYLIFRDARRMDKRPWWRRTSHRKAKPARGPASNQVPDALKGAGPI